MHNLIVGNSTTGKSNLGKHFARNAIERQQSVIVYDPLRSTGWPESAVKFTSPGLFLDYIETATEAHVFVDEAKSLWDFDTKRADALLYRRRHQGLLIYLIAQRTRMVPPNARNQCSKVYAFRQQQDDAETLASEYSTGLYNCCGLQKGEFIASNGFTDKNYLLDYSIYPPVPVENDSQLAISK